MAAVGLGRRACSTGIPTRRATPEADSPAPAAATDYAGAAGVYGEDAGAEAAAAEEEEEELPAAPPGWSEELLNWMLSEKAGLLVEAQRAQRRQAELAAELDRLRARGGGAEREVQRLLVSWAGPGGAELLPLLLVMRFMLLFSVTICPSRCFGAPLTLLPLPLPLLFVQAERRSLLDRVQQLSSAEAEANAAVERLCMENDALASDLERSQEVCREMLAARRAARDALADMSAQVGRAGTVWVRAGKDWKQLPVQAPCCHLPDACCTCVSPFLVHR